MYLYGMKTFAEIYYGVDAAGKRRMAADLDVCPSALSQWATGKRLPEYQNMLQIYRRYGVSFESWDEDSR